MLIDLNFGDKNYRLSELKPLIESYKLYDSKLNNLDAGMYNFLKKIDKGKNKNVELHKKLQKAKQYLKQLKKKNKEKGYRANRLFKSDSDDNQA
jgi:hypothetical protein